MAYNPKVSVITSVYNGEKYLHQTVSSILNQSHTDFEFIVVNDGSIDNTRDILESIHDSRLKTIHQENHGLTPSLNIALLQTKGKYIARQDADDISLPDRLEKQVEFLENYKDYVLIGSNANLINENDEELGVYQLPLMDTEIRWAMLFRNPFCHSSVMIRGETIRKYGISYNDHIRTAQDFEFFARIIKFGKSANFERALVRYRVHPDQIGRLHRSEQQRNALLISQSNLNDLGIFLSEYEVEKLRAWAYEFPTSIEKDDIYNCSLLMKVLRCFERQQFVEKRSYKVLKNRYATKICNAINTDNIFHFMFSKLSLEMACEFGFLCFKNFSMRAIKKLV